MRKENMRNTQPFLLLLFIAAFSFFDGHSAKADEHVVAVQCDGDHNRILVRFGMNGGHYSEIPDTLSAEWTNVPTQEDGYDAGSDCVFKDGQKISISESADQETNGEGGGDIDAFFKMTINGHLVYDEKQVYRGHLTSIYDVSAVQYEGRTLLECNPHEVIENLNHEFHTVANPTCYDASERLSPGENFLSDQEKLTSKDEHDNPEKYYLPLSVPLPPMLYDRIRTYEVEHRYADAVREETVLIGILVADYGPDASEYNQRCWDQAHIPNLSGALSDCQTAIALLKHSYAFDPIKRKTVQLAKGEFGAYIYDSTGYVYLKLKLPAKAIFYYSAALSAYPNFASSLYGRALAEQLLGQTAAAATDFAAAKTIDPKITSDFGV